MSDHAPDVSLASELLLDWDETWEKFASYQELKALLEEEL